MIDVNKTVEEELNRVARKNKDSLNAALIVPLSPYWKFSTNGLYLLLATAGCGKSRFIIKHILMSEQLFEVRNSILLSNCLLFYFRRIR